MSKENDAPAERLTRVFHKIKDKRAELAAEFKEKDDKLSSQLEEVKKSVVGLLQRAGARQCEDFRRHVLQIYKG
jgi:hypothetical protein